MFVVVGLLIATVVLLAMKAESMDAPTSMNTPPKQTPPPNNALPFLGGNPYPSPQANGGYSAASAQFKIMNDYMMSSNNVTRGLRASLNPKNIPNGTGVLDPLPDTVNVGATQLATNARLPTTTFKY